MKNVREFSHCPLHNFKKIVYIKHSRLLINTVTEPRIVKKFGKYLVLVYVGNMPDVHTQKILNNLSDLPNAV
jgi:hypothetical protein